MPRRRDDRDDDASGEFRRPVRRTRVPVWVWAACSAVLAGGLGVVVLVATVVSARTEVRRSAAWDRDELRQAVMGKTASEVKAVLGPPDWTSAADPDRSAGYASFTYATVVRNPHTGERVGVVVRFMNGRVNEVE